MSALDHFGPLDELIQIIYQGTSKFVVLSNVDEENWSIHVGLVDDRKSGWWRGRWTNHDIKKFAGSHSTDEQLQAFADNISTVFVKGEMSVENWSGLRDEREGLNLTIGPKTNRPLAMQLSELTLQEAATYTARAFFEIANQAQKRNCMHNSVLVPSSSQTSSKLLLAAFLRELYLFQ